MSDPKRPAKRPAKRTSGRVTPKKQLTVTPTSGWKSSANAGGLIELPSGKVARLTNPGIHAFMEGGMIPNALMPIVTEALEQGKPPSKLASKDMMQKVKQDMSLLADIFHMMDAICIRCFVEPKVHPLPEDPADIDPDLIYVNEVDPQDKAFVMNWAVGGTSDLAKFRKELAGNLGAI